MSDRLPWNFRATCENNGTRQSSGNETCYDFPADSWFLDIFEGLRSSGQADTSIDSKLERSCEREYGSGQSSGNARKQEEMDNKISSEVVKQKQNDRSKKQRKAEVHNSSERRRRDRIKAKIKTLQELIPNCDKSDRASVLDDAVKYLKALKLQVEVISLSGGGGALFQVPYTSPTGMQTPLHQLGTFCSSRAPAATMSVPWASACSLHHSLPGGALGLPLMSVPQLQRPYLLHSQQLPASVNLSSVVPPNFPTGFSPQFNFSSQGDPGSQTIGCPSVSSSGMP